jgi:hypothetical protein
MSNVRRAVAISLGVAVCALCSVSKAAAVLEINDQSKMEIGIWAQGWYQAVDDAAPNDGSLHDFMARRAYLSVKGEVSPYFEFFTHVATDRLGQDGLDNSSLGLGSGAAFRDLWITLKLHDALKVQIGRMYVPLTRSFGTTSTKALLTTDLPFLQGGVRGTTFFTNKVGRDDGITLWGNPLDGLIQYRFMVAEGLEEQRNPDDRLRYAGRVALNLAEPEEAWFNQGTYLGKKKILSLGLGYDTQRNLTLNGVAGEENRVWTVDAFLDRPVGAGAVTIEAAYIDIQNSTQTHNFSALVAGDDAANAYVQAGYLLPGKTGPGRFQPYARYETIDVTTKSATDFITVGSNYYIHGHDGKISVDYTVVDSEGSPSRRNIVTLQVAVGF